VVRNSDYSRNGGLSAYLPIIQDSTKVFRMIVERSTTEAQFAPKLSRDI